MQSIDIEICTNSIQSAINAKKGGATRIELCQNLNEGGTTPSFSSIKYCIDTLKLRTYVLIRPRTGDFCYTDAEFESIKAEVIFCKQCKANGVVVGFLSKNGEIDKQRTSEIVQLAKPMDVTFHRAFDLCTNYKKALSDIIDCGCTRILTSGLSEKAIDGIDVIKNLVQIANGRIKILAGSGINTSNVKTIIEKTGVLEIHSSCKHKIATPQLNTSIADPSNFSYTETNTNEVKNIINIIKTL